MIKIAPSILAADFLRLGEQIKALKLQNIVIVSPDVGFAKQAKHYAAMLDAPIAIAYKERLAHDESAIITQIIGNVENKTAVVVDDFTTSGGTLASVAYTLKENGACEIYAAVTHGVLTEKALERINKSPLKLLIITYTVERQPIPLDGKIKVVSVAPIFGEAIRRIHNRESISEMFKDV